MFRPLTLCTFALLCAFPTNAFAQNKGPQGPTGVIAAPVKLQDFSDTVEALGTAKANETVVITADTAEKVTAIHFEDGQYVNKGDILITLDKSEEEAELRSAEASLAEAQSAYDRAKGLQDTSALSKGTLQERLAALQKSQAAIEEIKARIEKRDIAAPFDGALGLREVSVGALVQPGDQITTIDDISQIKVDFDVPSVYLSALRPGMKVIGHVEAFKDRAFEGEVTTINTQVDPVTRSVKVRAVIPNPDSLLKPGLLMSIDLSKDQRRALVIPEEALIKRGPNNFVYLIEENDGQTVARQQKVEIGGRRPGEVEVLSGLEEGDQIVAHGTVKIGDGAPVKVRALESEDTPLDELLKQKPASGGKQL